MSTKNKWVAGIIIVAIVIWAGYSLFSGTGSPSQTSSGPIRIGFMGPLTGDEASVGENGLAAVQIARDEINSAGGVNGRQVEVIAEDSKCDPTAAADAANKLVNVDKVTAIIGGLCSSETLAAIPIAQAAHIPIISYGSTNPKITTAGDYKYRFVPSDNLQGKFAAEYIANTLKAKRVAILYCLSDWCVGLHDVVKQRLGELGVSVVDEEGFQQGAQDLRTQVTKIKAANPDVVYFPAYTGETIIGLKQIKQLGLKVKLIGADGWDDPKIPAEAGSAADGAMYVIPANEQLPQSFIDKMAKLVGGPQLIAYSPRAYDILKALAGIMQSVGANSEKINAALKNNFTYKGIADTYTIDQNGDDVTAKYIIKGYEGGKIVELGQ
ncbi:MAG: ABC transporter substrate-binding protein [Minisyncoccia bacterium]|jgi:branched-chain amino acid transport system substrate-binding protein